MELALNRERRKTIITVMAQTIQDLFKKSSEYDQKHINNLSTRRVPQALLDAVEVAA